MASLESGAFFVSWFLMMKIENQLFEHLVESYFTEFGTHLKINNHSVLGGGCISRAFRLETNQGNYFLKWNSNGSNDLFLREADSLNELHTAQVSSIQFPKPILAKPIDELPGYLLTNYLQPGKGELDEEKLGRGLAELHQKTAEYYGFKTDNYCGLTKQDNHFQKNWISFYVENRIGHILNLIRQSRNWSPADEKISEQFLTRVPQLIGHITKPSLIHGDLWSGNYMYTNTVPALIDPCASYCDREFELGMMTLFGGFSQKVFDAYNEYFPLPGEWKDRNLIYQLYHVLNHYLLFGGFYKNQALDIMKKYL